MGGVGGVDEVVQVVSVRRVGMHALHLVHQKADVPRLAAAVHQSTHADRAVYRYIRYLMYRGRRGTSAVHQI